ncbi:hypothetical protein ACET3Z_018142 [Daucus carota]
MNLQDINPGPIDGSLLHLQREHRSGEIWRIGGGDSMRGDLFRRITDVAHEPADVLKLSTGGFEFVRDFNLHWFDALPLHEHRAIEIQARQNLGRRPKHVGGRARGRAAAVVDPVDAADPVDVPEDTRLGDDHDDGAGTSTDPPSEQPATTTRQRRQREPRDLEAPRFDLLTPTPDSQDPSDQSGSQQPPPLHHSHGYTARVPRDITPPSFDLGITLPGPVDGTSTDASQGSQQKHKEPSQTYVRRSKRQVIPTRCGTDGEKRPKK